MKTRGWVTAGSVLLVLVGSTGLSVHAESDSLFRSAGVSVGHLTLEQRDPAPASAVLEGAEEVQRCLREGPEWLRASGEDWTLELTRYWIGEDEVLASYCDEGVFLVGGYQQKDPPEDPSRRQPWLLVLLPDLMSDPIKVFPASTYAVWRSRAPYTLNELRSIDPDSGLLTFSGTSDSGERALLSAPLAIEE
jgi:hypothetical protein